jgi:hypothetical protein
MTDNPDRRPANTMHARAIEEAAEEQGGRWRKNTEVSIAGTGPIPHSSVLVGPEWSQDCVPPEEPLNMIVDELPDLTTVSGIDRHLLTPPSPEADDEGAPTE